MQGLESARRDPLADAFLLHGIRLIADGLERARDEGDAAARRDLVLAAQLVGQGTDFTGAGMASALGHALGARCGVGNGHAKAVVLPHTLRFNAPATARRLGSLAMALGLASDGDAMAVAARCAALFSGLAVPPRLRDLGVDPAALPAVAGDAVADWFLTQNPRRADAADVLALLEAAW